MYETLSELGDSIISTTRRVEQTFDYSAQDCQNRTNVRKDRHERTVNSHHPVWWSSVGWTPYRSRRRDLRQPAPPPTRPSHSAQAIMGHSANLCCPRIGSDRLHHGHGHHRPGLLGRPESSPAVNPLGPFPDTPVQGLTEVDWSVDYNI